MKDIKNAIKAYSDYCEALSTDPFNANVYKYLAPYGYTDLDDFTKDKLDYLFKHSNLTITTTNPDESLMKDLIEKMGQEQVFISINNGAIFAWHQDEDIDRDLYAANNVAIYETHGMGGTIISGPDDLDVAIILDHNNWAIIRANYFIEKVARALRDLLPGHEVVSDENDILVDNRKVIGMTSGKVGDMLLYMAHVSFSDMSDLTRILCPKQSTKTPGALPSELDRATLIDEFKSWFEEDA